MDIILVLKIVIVIIIILVFILTLRSIITNRKVKRIGYYSLSPIKDNSLSISDKLINKYMSFVKDMRKYVSKSEFLKKWSKKYEKYIKYTNRDKIKAIDFITNKIIIAIVFVILTMFSQVFSLKILGVYDYIINFFIGYFLLDIYLYFNKKKENKLISNELLRAIIIMNNAFKSGRSTMQAIKIVSEELTGPTKEEFKKMYIDLTFGLDLETVFKRFSKRVNVSEVKYITTSLTILNKTGGNIVKVFSSIERNFFNRRKLEEELRSLTASANAIFKILVAIPIFLFFLIFILNPTYFVPLITTPLGLLLLALILTIYITYIIIIRKIMKVGGING